MTMTSAILANSLPILAQAAVEVADKPNNQLAAYSLGYRNRIASHFDFGAPIAGVRGADFDQYDRGDPFGDAAQ